MPLFMLKNKYFENFERGKTDALLKNVRSQWKNSKVGDITTLQSGRRILRKRITRICRGSLARIFLECDYKRIFPNATTVFEAVEIIRKIYPNSKEFMAFELENLSQ